VRKASVPHQLCKEFLAEEGGRNEAEKIMAFQKSLFGKCD